jgi:hypothetical protein
MTDFSRQIEFLKQHSTYAQRWLNARPEWIDWLEVQGAQKIDVHGIQELLTPCQEALAFEDQNEAQFMADLRLARQRLMLWVAFRDLNGMADLDEVTHALSHFAEQVVSLSIAYIREDLKRRFGLPWSSVTNSEMPLMVVGMGKLGGLELNLSSDIDLIFLYEHEGETQDAPKSLSYHEWFTRMGKRLIKLLTDVTGFGLAGHTLELARGSNLTAQINWSNVPLLSKVADLAQQGVITGASGRNWESYGKNVLLPKQYSAAQQALLTDPQTSGGLLVSCSADAANDVLEIFKQHQFLDAAVIGEMLPKQDQPLVISP